MKKLLTICALLTLVCAFSCRKKVTEESQPEPVYYEEIITEPVASERISGPMPKHVAWAEDDLK
ncbi:MAG: hypothetical protein WA432_02725 [Candidatus Babeliaceae bacterium]